MSPTPAACSAPASTASTSASTATPQKLHEGLTRTPGSFDQTVAGIDTVARYKRHGIASTPAPSSPSATSPTSPTSTRSSAPTASTRSSSTSCRPTAAPTPTSTSSSPPTPRSPPPPRPSSPPPASARVLAFFVDIPLCTTTELPDFNRGYVEDYAHFEPPNPRPRHRRRPRSRAAPRRRARRAGPDPPRDLDDSARHKRPECRSCRYDPVCEGVWGNYLRRHGWDEF
jgi:hypothetical protein